MIDLYDLSLILRDNLNFCHLKVEIERRFLKMKKKN